MSFYNQTHRLPLFITEHWLSEPTHRLPNNTMTAIDPTISRSCTTTMKGQQPILWTMLFFASFVCSSTAAFTSSSASPGVSHVERRRLALSSFKDASSAAATVQPGPLSMSIDELAIHLGGYGRARTAWDCYLLGVDPLVYFKADQEADEAIQALLPTGRRSTTLGKDALQRLADLGGLVDGGIATLSHVSTSSDKTTKLLLRLGDGLQVETVIIPWNDERSTLCISSQVGCRQACTFCATGKMGMVRNLTSDEMVAQVFFANRITRLNQLPAITHVVFMGMGEPSDNAAAVVKTAKQLTTRELFQLSRTKVTISTVAPTPGVFETLAQANVMLAWSVHASDNVLRNRLVPTTKYTMEELRQGLIATMQKRHPTSLRTVMVEMALMAGVNDRPEDADHLAEFLSPIFSLVPGAKLAVNLIPFNDIGHGSTFRTPTQDAVIAFQQRLWKHGIAAFVRATRGDDESAACGQLATSKKKKLIFL